MQLNKFMKDAGFKILALSGLSSAQYAIVLYLINCAASGMDEIQTTHSEFSSLMGYDEDTLREALLSLTEKKIIRLLPGESNANAIKISFEFDVHHWIIHPHHTLTPHDAVVFPFKSQKGPKKDSAPHKDKSSSHPEDWEVVLNEYASARNLSALDL